MSKQPMNISAIENALNEGLNTTIYEIYVPSLKKKLSFKPLTVNQCKTMAKIMISANENPFDTFKAVVAMIKSTCVDEIDMNELTELDRISLMLEFYTNNNILKDFDINCPKCNHKNKIKIDLDNIISNLENVSTNDIEFDNEQENKLTCLVGIPKLPVMHMFYKAVQDGKLEMDDMTHTFIKELKLQFSNKNIEPIELSIELFDDITDFIESIKLIPYIVTTNKNDNKSIFDIIIKLLDDIMPTDSENYICSKCGYNFGEVASAQNFI